MPLWRPASLLPPIPKPTKQRAEAQPQMVFDRATEDLSAGGQKYVQQLRSRPQLVSPNKDEQDWSDLVVAATRLVIQKLHEEALIDDFLRRSDSRAAEKGEGQPSK